MKRFIFQLSIISTFIPAFAFAAGGHDDLSCVGCHAIHTAQDDIIFAVKANTKDINPLTKQPYGSITALCLGCHQTGEKGGEDILPVSGHTSHPYDLGSVNKKVASVPETRLRNGRFECVGCHDPHPSNPNYKYLLVDTKKGAKMAEFCSVCHPVKTDPSDVGKQPLFDSMDNRFYKQATIK